MAAFGAMDGTDGTGTVDVAAPKKRRARVWRYGAFENAETASWIKFFGRLTGRPLYVVCDGDPALLSAIEKHWPGMPAFRCTAHLTMQAQELVRKAGLRETPFGRALNEKTFTSGRRWGWFKLNLGSLEEDGLLEGASTANLFEVEKLRRWAEQVAPDIEFNLDSEHAPWSTGGLERPLRVLKNSLFDRRFALRNLDRLDHLLVLFQMAQIGLADPTRWAHILQSVL